MTSVIGTAFEIYQESEKNAQEIARRNGILCTVKIPPLRFKSWGMKFSLEKCEAKYESDPDPHPSYPEIQVTLKGRKVTYRFGNKGCFEKDHLLTRFLLQNVEWNKRPKSIAFYEFDTETFDIPSTLRVDRIRGERSPSFLDSGYHHYNELTFYVPERSVDVLDTVFYIYKGREPRLSDFLSEEMAAGRTAEADIRELPELPKTPEPKLPEVRTKERMKFPVNNILETVIDYRTRASERYSEARKKIKDMTGKKPEELSCGTREVSFWRNDGYEFLGRINKSSIIRPILNSGKLTFPNELPILAIGQHLGRYFYFSSKLEVPVDDYLKANSVLDLIDEHKLEITKFKGIDSFSITGNKISSSWLGKKGVRRLFELASEISSIAD
jgi:hypothetical protein